MGPKWILWVISPVALHIEPDSQEVLNNCRATKGQNFAQNEQKRVQADYRKQIERGDKSVNVAT